ncbi:MAG TPA: FkbM family methyltransferase [Bryobacteraceae bacterium]
MLHLNLRLRRSKTIFEVGAYIGDDELIETCRKHGHRLYLFEPNPRCVEILRRKTEGMRTAEVVPAAISNFRGTAQFHIACHDDCSSLQEFDENANKNWVHEWHPYKNFEMVDRFEVEVIRLDGFMEANGIETVDLLEIDAQGEDLRVVESLGDRLRDVKKIQIEVNIHSAPLYKGGCTMTEALAFFSAHGFEKHISWKQCLNREENVIFRNKRFYKSRLLNLVSSRSEQYYRSARNAWVKLPRVLAVTGMMLRQRFGGQRA